MKKNYEIVSQQTSLSDWYTSVVEKAELIHYSSIKGFMSFLPRGWGIWEQIQKQLNLFFKELNIVNVALPSLFPYSDLLLEANHVEGFKPELFLIQSKGYENLQEPYVLRPTSEVAFCKLWSEILQNYNQLPLLYNQWCSVFRVEKNTRPFLRNSEFYWQEMHGAFIDEKSCKLMVDKVHNVYKKLINEILMIPTLNGLKSPNERFAGAITTHTLETIMPDGQALQSATTHNLGQNFSKAFNIKFQNSNNTYDLVHTMSAGLSTRIIGALIMSHGDDNGLVLPFKVAPVQIVILTLMANKNPQIIEKANEILNSLKDCYRVQIDSSNNSIGFKINQQEIYGTPVVIILGPNDLKNNEVVIKWRNNVKKISLKINEVKSHIDENISSYDQNLYDKVLIRYENQITKVYDFESFKKELNNQKVLLAPWNGSDNDEQEIKKMTGATIRCIVDLPINNEICVFTKQPAKSWVYFARAY
ncbi:proline--tRNA ligase [Mycoplasmoides pirum]|uniref:proline--tRNA ligase n=1 Tax=Mycoplasmoides pirum TaxID=2122 RepID=UPI000568CAFE|nr:proline--tRNA ligase [Mycoplasmoides pirum]